MQNPEELHNSLMKLCAAYHQSHPKAQDPLDYTMDFGYDGLHKILMDAEGKEIRFIKPEEGTQEGTQFAYV